MTTKTVTSCDRCGSDVTGTDYWQVAHRKASEIAMPTVTTPSDDLCVPCKDAFERFMERPASESRTADRKMAC